MTTEEATEILGVHGSMPCTVQFWGTDTPARNFDTLHDGLRFIADAGKEEPLPDLHIHGNDGDMAINGPDLEQLLAVSRAMRSPL
ncbi:hypothetical protein AB6806_20210 [Bosea sp. RCC_152_1]|uniref:hypothetical protein n=1 Tax=Bosea sp. RCC_152_1 TaxID=3239228 RepID=UPI0035242DA6